MPSPIGHALGGLVVGLALAPKLTRAKAPYPPYIAACAIAACAPDIDFLWGRHSMETHSVFAATAIGIVVWIVTRQPWLALACAASWASHVLFDWLGSDDTPPLGVMALWPVTDTFYFAEAYVFDAISRQYPEPAFWRQNIPALIKEVVFLGPAAALLWRWRGLRLRE